MVYMMKVVCGIEREEEEDEMKEKPQGTNVNWYRHHFHHIYDG